MNSEDFDKLRRLFEEFDGRPNHLAKFLTEKNAFSDSFIKKLEENSTDIEKRPNFKTIKEMNRWFSKLVDDLDKLKKKRTRDEIIKELNKKLNNAILTENFEEACRIRDYMIKNNYKEKPND